MATPLKIALPQDGRAASSDQRVVMSDVPWSHYEILLAIRGDKPVPRITYRQGVLELMSPSREHERIKALLTRLIEVYAEERGIELAGYGSWTLKSAAQASGIEPDACFVLGENPEAKGLPDLAIEVAMSSGATDKLAAYRLLGVAEVWFWEAGTLEVYVLRAPTGYEEVGQSALLPGLDLALVAGLVRERSSSRAARALRDRLRGSQT